MPPMTSSRPGARATTIGRWATKKSARDVIQARAVAIGSSSSPAVISPRHLVTLSPSCGGAVVGRRARAQLGRGRLGRGVRKKVAAANLGPRQVLEQVRLAGGGGETGGEGKKCRARGPTR